MHKSQDNPDLMTVREAALRLGTSLWRTYHLRLEGKLGPAVAGESDGTRGQPPMLLHRKHVEAYSRRRAQS